MKKIEQFTEKYTISKTLRFGLIPQGKTEEFFDWDAQLTTDENRAADYAAIKELMDRYHKDYIERMLNGFHLEYVAEYAKVYRGRGAERDKKLQEYSKRMYEAISNQLQGKNQQESKSSENRKETTEYSKLFSEKMLSELLPNFAITAEEKATVIRMNKFSTYFRGFWENRNNMYTGDGKSTEIAYRIVEQNLPRYLDNCVVAETAFAQLDGAVLEKYRTVMETALQTDIQVFFTPAGFDRVLGQRGIDAYNQLIGGFTRSDGTEEQGLNQLINLYNQQYKTRLPKLKPLYKQILSDRSTLSYLPEQFDDDNDLLRSINAFWHEKNEEIGLSVADAAETVKNMLCTLNTYDTSRIFVENGPNVAMLSNLVYGYWGAIGDGLIAEYDANNAKNKARSKNPEVYQKKRADAIKAEKSFSLGRMQAAVERIMDTTDNKPSINKEIAKKAAVLYETVQQSYSAVTELLHMEYPTEKKLQNDSDSIALIKSFLDSIKELQQFAKCFLGSGREESKDDTFYGEYAPLYEQLNSISRLYDKVRNYLTKKPFSTDKIKLNFNNPQLLCGWDRNKEEDCSAVLMEREGQYYLGIMAGNSRRLFRTVPKPDGDEPVYRKMVLKLIPKPYRYFNKYKIEPQHPPAFVMMYLDKKKNAKETITTEETRGFIDYCINDFLVNYPSILDEEGNNYFHFTFRKPEEYASLNEFFEDVDRQAYAVHFIDVPAAYVDEAVEKGSLYLFQIYSKDFSPNSKGTPNLHTLYFRALFDEMNKQNHIFKLCGGAEIFCRKPSIKPEDRVIHPKDVPVKNKNTDNPKAESLFSYDLIKDRRYTQRKFFLHVPIQLNYNSGSTKSRDFNHEVRMALRDCENNYVIGIDRGERNLIYICVIDGFGNIVEQHSLNSIVSGTNAAPHSVDYQKLLDQREQERDTARKSWSTIEGIKELKEGYLSQVVHKLCELVVKYDAVIALEDLNSGFKNSRVGVEKQVYQKFEKMLIDKLGFYADKGAPAEAAGGLYHGYQLTCPFVSFKDMKLQNGFLFYIPAWMTSKMDPTTGFVNLLYTRYESINATRDFICGFDEIRYNKAAGYYEFAIDYDRFPRGSMDWRKKWTLTSYGDRIDSYRNQETNRWTQERVDLTQAFSKLFADAGINTDEDIQQQLLCMTQKEHYARFMKLVSLMVQMRNSIIGSTNAKDDYLLSPVMNAKGFFYDSRTADKSLPMDADANGAYHIARKAQWVIERIKQCEVQELDNLKTSITNKEWLEYVQSGLM